MVLECRRHMGYNLISQNQFMSLWYKSGKKSFVLGWVLKRPSEHNVSNVRKVVLSGYHYNDVIMSAVAPQITSLTIIYWTGHSGVDQRKHQSSASLAFVWEFTGHRWISRTKGVTRKIFPFDDGIMMYEIVHWWSNDIFSQMQKIFVQISCHEFIIIYGIGRPK